MYHHVSPCITMYHHVSPCITIVFDLAAPLLEYSAGFAVMRTTSLDTGDSKTSTWENNTRYWVKAGPLLSVFSYLIHSESVIHSVARKDTNERLDCLCALRVFEDLLSILGITLHLAVLSHSALEAAGNAKMKVFCDFETGLWTLTFLSKRKEALFFTCTFFDLS